MSFLGQGMLQVGVISGWVNTLFYRMFVKKGMISVVDLQKGQEVFNKRLIIIETKQKQTNATI